ncbi:MAG: HK97 family phage prohead protease, partial [Acidimicrobiia bacterium]
FKRTIDHWSGAGKALKLLNSHKKERCEDVIGEVKSMCETPEGLEVAAKMADTPQANAVWNLIKARLVDGLSIGYSTVPGKWRKEMKEINGSKKSIRVLEEIKLFEISAVVFGANPNAVIVAAKGLAEDAAAWAKEQEPDPEPSPDPAPEPDPEPEAEPEEEPEPTPEEAVLASLEAELEEKEDQLRTAVETEDFFEAGILKPKIEGLESRIRDQKRLIEAEKRVTSPWTVDNKVRLEAEARLASTLARAS